MFYSWFNAGFNQIKNIKLNKSKLAKQSIYFEQNIMREIVGSQDQTLLLMEDLIKFYLTKIILLRLKISSKKI